VACRLGRHRLAKLRQAGGRRVFVVAHVAAGLRGRLDYVVRGWKVGFSGTEADDVLAGLLEGLGLGVYGESGRLRDGRYAL
jgi:hypothetical protein